MKVGKLWERYLLKEALKIFTLFLTSFFLLYLLIDCSMHLQKLLKEGLPIGPLLLYYALLLSKRCELLLPLSLLIAAIKLLTTLNQRNELLAFQSAGLSIRKLSRPLFALSISCALLCYLNFEFLAPHALRYTDHFEMQHLNQEGKRGKAHELSSLILEDGTQLIYQSYDNEKREFFDLFWVHSIDQITHAKRVALTSPYPTGYYIDEMERGESGEMQKSASYERLSLPHLILHQEIAAYIEEPLENRSISALLHLARSPAPFLTKSRPATKTQLFFKLLIPLLSPLLLIGIIPFCTPSKRSLPTFALFALSIFGYIALFTVMDGCVILGERGISSPFWSVASPLLFAFLLLFPRYRKLKK